MSTYEYLDASTALRLGDCLDAMADLPAEYIDAIVTDPPYGLGFMGKAWDELPPGDDWAKQCFRVLKPGGHLLAFGGTRTWHRLAVAIEDAGFEIRDSIAWLYGSGFPKSLDVSKAIDKAAGAEREVIGINPRAAQQTPKPNATTLGRFAGTSPDLTAPATPDAQRWQGWGTALKPAFEPIVVARKPFTGTVAANVLAHGTGALNIDGTRIAGTERPVMMRTTTVVAASSMSGVSTGATNSGEMTKLGRWPANVILDESQAVELDGGASRFYYVAKASAKERPRVDGVAHPTVKPLALMRWLVRLVMPPDGILLDPFAGSGTTLQAAQLEGFRSLGIEREPTYAPLIRARCAA